MTLKRYLLGFVAMLTLVLQPLTAAVCKSEKHAKHDKCDCCQQVKKIVRKIDDKQQCEFVIHAKDITKEGFVIRYSGSWCLDGDVEFTPANPVVPTKIAAIRIASDNVVLNLNNHTISQGNTVQGVIGIQLDPALKDVSIVNGTLQRFTQAAIFSFIPDTFPQSSSKHLLFQNLTIINNGVDGQSRPETDDGTGIALQSPGSASSPNIRTDYKYYDVTIDSCNINNNIGVQIMAAQINGFVVKDNHADNAFINNPIVRTNILGMTMKNSVNIQLLNSTFNNSTLFSGLGDRVGGIRASDCFYMIIDGCQFNGHTAVTSFNQCIGIQGGMNNTWLIQNSQFCNLFGGATGGIVNGLHSTNIANQTIIGGGFKIINCQFNNISAVSGNLLAGILVDVNRDIWIEDCQFINYAFVSPAAPTDIVRGISVAFNNATPVDDTVASVLAVTLKGNVMSNFVGGLVRGCSIAMPNQLAKPPGVPLLANVMLENNTIAHLVGSGATFGLLLQNVAVAATSPTFTFKNAVIKNNNIMDVRGAAGSGGIVANNVKNPVVTNNIVEDSDIGILFTGSGATGFVNKGLVQENKVANCTVGYQDDLVPTNSGWISNVASLNGTNYLITWTGAPPIDTGLVIAPYPAPGNKYYNLSLN